MCCTAFLENQLRTRIVDIEDMRYESGSQVQDKVEL